ncbi:MAG TPA: FAD/NAD(P)-binding protein [Dissulfurispiraceae bacterium]|nr:FAD/NAD(P)-binding protein [Dissulfurispiraceae bacterium]
MKNPYLPYPVRIEETVIETEDRNIKSFKLAFLKEEDCKAFDYTPGQFAQLSVTGKGEIPIGIASSPTEGDHLLFTVNKMGVVTTALHNLSEGSIMGVRGPLGNSYPFDKMKGKDVTIIGGGYAFTTLRSTIVYMLDGKNRADFGKITLIYGARTPGMLLYKETLEEWSKRDDISYNVTVDRDAPGWTGRVGFVPAVTEQVAPSSENAIAVICGPPIMIKFTLPVMVKLGFTPEQTITSLENRMKCGIGICGRCNVGPEYVCKDGPVFSMAQLKEMPQEY